MKKKKTLAQLKNELQIIFNEFIRLRDKGKPCISCGKFHKLQAGHFFAVSGYDGLRYDEDNVHGECAHCNGFDQSHLISYADNLKYRIGMTRYLRLKKRAKDYKKNGNKFMKYELEEKIKEYRKKIKTLKT